MKQIIASKIVTPDGTILQSYCRHDFKQHKDLNGKTYSIDGGTSYTRILGDIEDLEVIQITNKDDFEVIRSEMYWGTYGKHGNKERKWVYLNEMSNAHIKAILETQSLPTWVENLFKQELEYREENSIFIQDTD